jgi:hypothetical protein
MELNLTAVINDECNDIDHSYVINGYSLFTEILILIGVVIVARLPNICERGVELCKDFRWKLQFGCPCDYYTHLSLVRWMFGLKHTCVQKLHQTHPRWDKNLNQIINDYQQDYIAHDKDIHVRLQRHVGSLQYRFSNFSDSTLIMQWGYWERGEIIVYIAHNRFYIPILTSTKAEWETRVFDVVFTVRKGAATILEYIFNHFDQYNNDIPKFEMLLRKHLVLRSNNKNINIDFPISEGERLLRAVCKCGALIIYLCFLVDVWYSAALMCCLLGGFCLVITEPIPTSQLYPRYEFMRFLSWLFT